MEGKLIVNELWECLSVTCPADSNFKEQAIPWVMNGDRAELGSLLPSGFI